MQHMVGWISMKEKMQNKKSSANVRVVCSVMEMFQECGTLFLKQGLIMLSVYVTTV